MTAAQKPEAQAVAWANAANLTSARLGRERYGAHGACELHTWREGGPTDFHTVPLFDRTTLDAAVAEAVAAERALWQADAERYRWLRDNAERQMAICEWADEIGYYMSVLPKEATDAAIDTAIRRTTQDTPT